MPVGDGWSAADNFDLLTLNNNKIGGNLQCRENRRAPTGGQNRVGGTKEDQCRQL